ncbi:MAG: hypothetical protein PF636_08570, partial [Actinomycetota bacterium]|nr:hypothetical protein [Actinomycetota bacterium]
TAALTLTRLAEEQGLGHPDLYDDCMEQVESVIGQIRANPKRDCYQVFKDLGVYVKLTQHYQTFVDSVSSLSQEAVAAHATSGQVHVEQSLQASVEKAAMGWFFRIELSNYVGKVRARLADLALYSSRSLITGPSDVSASTGHEKSDTVGTVEALCQHINVMHAILSETAARIAAQAVA